MKNNPKWYYEEKQSGVNYLDPKIVQEYDNEHRRFRNFEDETAQIVKMLGITSEDIVLDFGCGTGGITLNLAKFSRKVIGVDISREMLDVLREKAEKQGINNIKTFCGGFLSYNHESNNVDKIVSIFALHHLPDFWKSVALVKMAEILKTGGKLYIFDVIFTFDAQDHHKSLEEMINGMRKVSGDSMARETEVHIRDDFSTYDWIMEGLLERSGFSIDYKHVEANNFIGYVCSKL